MRQPDGCTLREHYEAAARQGRRPADLDGPPCPPELVHVWKWFLALSGGRGNNGFGPDAIRWLDIDAWARLNRVAPTPYELACLQAVDAVFMEESQKKTP